MVENYFYKTDSHINLHLKVRYVIGSGLSRDGPQAIADLEFPATEIFQGRPITKERLNTDISDV